MTKDEKPNLLDRLLPAYEKAMSNPRIAELYGQMEKEQLRLSKLTPEEKALLPEDLQFHLAQFEKHALPLIKKREEKAAMLDKVFQVPKE